VGAIGSVRSLVDAQSLGAEVAWRQWGPGDCDGAPGRRQHCRVLRERAAAQDGAGVALRGASAPQMARWSRLAVVELVLRRVSGLVRVMVTGVVGRRRGRT